MYVTLSLYVINALNRAAEKVRFAIPTPQPTSVPPKKPQNHRHAAPEKNEIYVKLIQFCSCWCGFIPSQYEASILLYAFVTKSKKPISALSYEKFRCEIVIRPSKI